MDALLMLLLAASVAFGCALLVGRTFQAMPSLLLTTTAVAIILLCPLLIPSSAIQLRAISALISGDIAFKMCDCFRLRRVRKQPLAYAEFCWFIVPFPFLLVVFRDKITLLQIRSRWGEVAQLTVAMVFCILGLALMYAVSLIPAAKANFLLDHILKLSAFTVFLEALSRCLYRLERLAGFDTSLIVDDVIKSRTVSEFWVRYNTRVQSWFFENVFRPMRNAPALAVVTVFSVNGLLHELMFGIATSRFDGYQLLFFLVQIPAVLGSRHLRRFAVKRGRPAVMVLRVSTIVWVFATSILFFHGVNRIVPFYSATSCLP